MKKSTTRGSATYVGLDVHKASISVALLREGQSEPESWQIQNNERSLKKLAKKLLTDSEGEVVCCYEAGPCGYAVQRWLASHGVRCEVVAPALIPVKPGERGK